MSKISIEQIKIIREGDSTFAISFLVDSHNLQVNNIPNDTPEDQILVYIQTEVERWRTRCAEDNLRKIRETYEGKSVTLDVKE